MTKKAPIFLILLLLILGGAGYYYYSSTQQIPQDTDAEEIMAEVEEMEPVEVVTIDEKAAISERILGNPNAPVKISEHASFSCSHCAAFHKSTFKALKANLIDTGKAYLVFSDFPLNGPALYASMTARCMPQDKYFDFVDLLFETQDEWAFDQNFMGLLQEKAATFGMDEATFKACAENKNLQEGIINRMRAAQAQWEINATPSFVIDNETVMSGAQPLESFEDAIAKAQAPDEGAAAEPTETTPAAGDETAMEEAPEAEMESEDTPPEPEAEAE